MHDEHNQLSFLNPHIKHVRVVRDFVQKGVCDVWCPCKGMPAHRTTVDRLADWGEVVWFGCELPRIDNACACVAVSHWACFNLYHPVRRVPENDVFLMLGECFGSPPKFERFETIESVPTAGDVCVADCAVVIRLHANDFVHKGHVVLLVNRHLSCAFDRSVQCKGPTKPNATASHRRA